MRVQPAAPAGPGSTKAQRPGRKHMSSKRPMGVQKASSARQSRKGRGELHGPCCHCGVTGECSCIQALTELHPSSDLAVCDIFLPCGAGHDDESHPFSSAPLGHLFQRCFMQSCVWTGSVKCRFATVAQRTQVQADLVQRLWYTLPANTVTGQSTGDSRPPDSAADYCTSTFAQGLILILADK